MQDHLDPPALVRTYENRADLRRHAHDLNADIMYEDRRNLDRALDLGDTLVKLKAFCKHGEWGAELESLKIHPRRASEYTRIAKSDARPISDATSIREALERVKEDADDEEDDTPQEDASSEETGNPSEEAPNTSESNGHAESPMTIYCPDCLRKKRVGQEVSKKCKDCKKLREAAEQKDEPQGTAEETPEPVQDDIEQEVPDHLLSVFEKVADFKTIISQLGKVGKELKDVAQHPAGAMLRLQQAEVDLKNLKRTVRFDRPFCVCPVCKGLPKGRKANCPCKARGWLNEASYENLPSEYRK